MAWGAIFFVRPFIKLKRLMFCASGAESGHNSAQISARFCIWTGRSNLESNVLIIFIFMFFLWAVGGDVPAAARGD